MPVVGACSNYQSKMTRLFETAIMPHILSFINFIIRKQRDQLIGLNEQRKVRAYDTIK